MESSARETENRHGRDMTRGSIPHHLVMFSLPMLAGNIIQTAYSLVNAMWVGKFLGKTDLAAVTVSFPVIFLLIAIAGGLTMGTSILVAQYVGARSWDHLRKVVQTSTVMLCCVSVGLLIIGQLCAPWILSHMDTPNDVYALAASYMRVILFTIPFSFGFFLTAAMLRGVGDSKTPLYFQTGALILTAIFDPILMFGWLGFPRFGLNGTAIASTSMQAVGMFATFIYLYRKDHIVAPDWKTLSVDWPTMWLTVKIGFPSIIQQSIVSIGMLFVMGIVNGFGENATAAFGAAMRIDQLAFLPAMTFGMAVSTMAGQNLGASMPHRVKEVFWWGTAICAGITIIMSTFAVTQPQLLLKMFLNDPGVISTGIGYLRIVGSCYIFFAIMFVSNGVINGAGYTFVTTIISLIALWLARVPLAFYLSQHLHRVEGVWYAMAVSSGVSMVISVACYFSGFWKRPVIRHSPVPQVEEA